MGPAIILDKSAVEAIGNDALWIQSEYFYTVITPILVWEVCGDLEKARKGKIPESKVRALAYKANPFDSIATTDWRKCCLGELPGYTLNFDRVHPRPLVDGAHSVPVPSGGYGAILDVQPEAQALLRWSRGQWTHEDRLYAQQWKRMTKAIDLRKFQKTYGPGLQKAESPEDLRKVVDQVIADPSLQMFLLDVLLGEIKPALYVADAIRKRWQPTNGVGWQDPTRYCHHAIRTILMFHLAIASGIVTIKSTNRVDLEYLFYLPFAPIFVSGDEQTHGKLAPLLMASNQVYVPATDFRNALQQEAERVASLREKQPEPDADSFEAPEGSLIRDLWIKSWGKFRPPPSRRKIKEPTDLPPSADETVQEFMRAAKFVEEHPEMYPKRPAWPGVRPSPSV